MNTEIIQKRDLLLASFIEDKDIKQYKFPMQIFWPYAKTVKYMQETAKPDLIEIVKLLWSDEYFKLEQNLEDMKGYWIDKPSYLKDVINYFVKDKVLSKEFTKETLGEAQKYLANLDNHVDEWGIEFAVNEMVSLVEDGKNWTLWYSTPYECFDKITWGIRKWSTMAISAFSNMWKSKFSYWLVNQLIKDGKSVIFFSLEVGKWTLLMNLLANYYKKDFNEVEKGIEFDYSIYEKLKVYDDKYHLNEIKEITEREKPDVIFIDYIQNVRTEWNWEYEKMTAIASELQLLWIKTKASIISLSQVSNESRNASADKVNLKWSWAMFASNDIILLLHKDEDFRYLSVVKNKFWPAFVRFIMKTDFSKWIFSLEEDAFNSLT